jgi:exonuclease VII small subunit
MMPNELAALWELIENADRTNAESIRSLQRGIDALTERVEELEGADAKVAHLNHYSRKV